MIVQLSKKILDEAYYGFPANGRVASNERFSDNNVNQLAIAIRKMFELLDFQDKDLSILDRIKIHFLDGESFAYANCANTFIEGFEFGEVDDAKREAIAYYKQYENENTEAKIIMCYSNAFACSVKQNILVNKSFVTPQLGLHLICHEIMHSLASTEYVRTMRDVENHGKEFGDEAVNEFFARLATLIFNSMDDGNSNISGYTVWDDTELFPESPQASDQHSAELGLYGNLLATDAELTTSDWDDPEKAIEKAKELAKYYFKNKE